MSIHLGVAAAGVRIDLSHKSQAEQARETVIAADKTSADAIIEDRRWSSLERPGPLDKFLTDTKP